MDPAVYGILPWFALAVFLVCGLLAAARPPRAAWIVPAGFSLAFLGWSAWTIASEGLTAVWAEHTRNAWGNQIWFDLLMAIGLGFAVLTPRARAAGMRPLPWLVLVACTGSVGLFAMMARCLFLETRKPATAAN